MNDGQEIFVICDRNVEKLAREISPGSPLLPVTADEAHKTMDTVMQICRWLLEHGADRDAVLYAVGGGVTTDMVGFAASIYKRGIRYVNYPTTLLSQVDAGTGGKTGVNLDGYKNILGTVWFPEETRILPGALRTLPPRELRSGAAEMLKSFIIADRDNYQKAVALLPKAMSDPDSLAPLIAAAAAVKKRIVAQDPREKGPRRLLNLGHTFGHAIEWYQSTCREGAADGSGRLSHGEAVAIGIVQAARMSEDMGIAARGLAERIARDFASCGLPTELPFPAELLEQAIWKDKKVEHGIIHFVLIRDIGDVIIKDLNDLHLHTEQGLPANP